MRTANFSYPLQGGFQIPFSYDAAIQSLPAYCASEHTGQLLDPLLDFLNDGSYIQTARAIPSTQQQNPSNVIQPNQTYEDQISVPAGSYLTMIAGFAQNADLTRGFFRCRIFEVGSQSYLSDDFVNGRNLSSWIFGNRTLTNQPFRGQQDSNNLLGAQNTGIGPFILPSPMAVSSPGQLTIQLVSLSSQVMMVDMAFYFAVPIGGHIEVGPGTASRNFTRSSIR